MAKKILIVDDEKDLLLVLEKGLNAEGYSVITAETGKKGLLKAQTEHPDLIILDLALPDMLGGEVAVRLKKDVRTKDIPIVFLSAMFTKTEESKREHIAGGNIMFAKPYDIEDMTAAIDNLLKQKKEHRATPRRRTVRRGKIMMVDAGDRSKILLVDDEEDILRTMGRQLKSFGYDVVVAADGSSAISVALAEEPDLIILDIGLPAGDGFYVMRNITSNPRTAITPIIVITCRDAADAEEDVLKAGAQAFFQKPVDMDKFLTTIEEILEEPIEIALSGGDRWENE